MMISPDANCGLRPFNFALTALASADLKSCVQSVWVLALSREHEYVLKHHLNVSVAVWTLMEGQWPPH